MDLLAGHNLDTTSYLQRFHRDGYARDVLAGNGMLFSLPDLNSELTSPELYHRLLRFLCQLCYSGKHFCLLNRWCGFPTVRHEHVCSYDVSRTLQGLMRIY